MKVNKLQSNKPKLKTITNLYKSLPQKVQLKSLE